MKQSYRQEITKLSQRVKGCFTFEIITPLIYTKKDWDNKYSITSLHENIQNEGRMIYG